ncbi:MAG: GerMN domain-containing protein [Lachnospiraceae bacterium]
MLQNRKIYMTLCIALMGICVGLLAGCSKGKEPGKNDTFVYYLNTEGTALVKEVYKFEKDRTKEAVGDVLREMKKEPDSIDYKSVFPKKVQVEDWTLTDEAILDIHFNEEYGRLKPSEELLLRAAVVQTLAQIRGIEYIDFFIGDAPLTDSAGETIGYMSEDDFLQYRGSSLHLYQLGKVKLYFSNGEGSRLLREEVSVRYSNNMSIERLIVDQLIKGPSMNGLHPVLPPETKVIGVSVKDTVCYVNLDEGFLNNTFAGDPKVTVYAIVNSIIDGGTCSQVQISVNGDSNIEYMGSVDLSKPLSRDLDLVEESGK